MWLVYWLMILPVPAVLPYFGCFWREKSESEREDSDNGAGISWWIKSNKILYSCKRADRQFVADFFLFIYMWNKEWLQIYDDRSTEVLQLRINLPQGLKEVRDDAV